MINDKLFYAGKFNSQNATRTLRNIKLASLTQIALIAIALLYIRFFIQGEDAAGPIMLDVLTIIALGAIATTADTYQKRIK